MELINKVIDLTGQWEEINVMDLRKHVGDILFQVLLGKTFLIKKASKPIAFISYLPQIGKSNVEIIIKVDGNGKIFYGI